MAMRTALALVALVLVGCVSYQEPTPLPVRPTPTAPPTPTPTLSPSYCAAARALLEALPLDAVTALRLGALVDAGDEATCRTVYNQLLGQGVARPTPTPTPAPTSTPTSAASPVATATSTPPPSATPPPSLTPPASLTPTPPPAPTTHWVNVGGERYTDGAGYAWEADPLTDASGALAYRLDVGADTDAVDGTVNDTLFLTGRLGVMTYAFPLAPGSYDVLLYLMDPANTGTGARLADVYIEGVLARDDLDVVREAEGRWRAATVVLAGHAVSDGTLDLVLRSNLADAVLPLVSPDRLPTLSGVHVRPAGTVPAPPTPTPTPTPDPLSRESLIAEIVRLSALLASLRADRGALLEEHCGSPTTECTLPPGAITTAYRNLVQGIRQTSEQLDETTRTYWLLFG
jgi:hypothetical protein